MEWLLLVGVLLILASGVAKLLRYRRFITSDNLLVIDEQRKKEAKERAEKNKDSTYSVDAGW